MYTGVVTLLGPTPTSLVRCSKVDANYGGSIPTKTTLPTSPYKILLNDSNGHGC